MPVSPELVSLDLFSGVGGISLGMEMAGCSSAVAVDLDPHAIETFNANFTGAHGIVGDLEEPKVRREVYRRSRAAGVNFIIGGPPCQGFSQVGNHRDLENDPRNRLYKSFVSAVRELRPRAFLMENVPGLAQRAGGKALEKVLESLACGGEYRVRASTLDAADYGVPQSRRRLFFLGMRADEDVSPRLPVAPHTLLERLALDRCRVADGYTYQLKRRGKALQASLFQPDEDVLDILSNDDDLRLVTVRQALSDLEHLEGNETLRQQEGDDTGRYVGPAQSAYQRLMRGGSGRGRKFPNAQVPFMWPDTRARLESIPLGGNYRDLSEKLQKRYLNGQKWGPESGRDRLSRKYFFAYRRLHPDFVSWTLNTKADCVYHYDGTRALSVREFARLSSFPDRFVIRGSDKHTRYRLVGNAVPPLLAKAIGDDIVASLAPPGRAKTKRAVTK